MAIRRKSGRRDGAKTAFFRAKMQQQIRVWQGRQEQGLKQILRFAQDDNSQGWSMYSGATNDASKDRTFSLCANWP